MIAFLRGFRPSTTVYVFEKNGNDLIYFTTCKRVDELQSILDQDYNKNRLSNQFENWINKQFYNGFTFYAKRYDQLNIKEKHLVETCETY